jgi:hypothetical protein
MKNLFYITFLILITMSASTASGQTEHRKYEVVKQFPGFEIRYYPEAVLASVYTDARSYRELSSPGFNNLAGYIFGGNAENQKIAMTAPVQMDISEQGSSMSFVMPSEYNLNNLPQPNNPAVKLETAPSEYIAAIEFGGYANDKRIIEESEKLRNLLDENKVSYTGNFRFLGYNSPYRVFGRRNEIVVRVIWE